MQFKCLLSVFKTNYVCYKSLNHVTVNARYYTSSPSHRNPYDVLGLKSTCSTKDVKKAYIKLCKELHPDMKPGDSTQHKKFVELNNAYTSLINAKDRRQVDYKYSSSSSDNFRDIFQRNKSKKAYGPFERDAWQKEEQWYEREDYRQQFRHQHSKEDIPNGAQKNFALTLCFLLVCVGSLLYFSAYRYATNYTMNTVNERSKKISEDYQITRKNALGNGREESIEKLKKRWSL